MKRLINLVVAFTILFSLALPLFVAWENTFADSGPVYVYGVNVTPYQENNVRLVKETLSIELNEDKDTHWSKAYVYAKFVFTNAGEKTIIKMGFPFGAGKDIVGTLPEDAVVKVEGKEVKTTHIEEAPSNTYGPWLIFDVPFNKGETKTIEVSYVGIPRRGHFVYILETGRYWKGPLGTLDISIKLPIEAKYPYLLSLKPGGYTIKGNEATYHFTNFEPSENIQIEFLPTWYYKQIEPLKAKSEKTNSASDWLNYVLALLPKNPFGPFQHLSEEGFVELYETDAFKNYLLNVINKALNLQEEGSPEQKVLAALRDARENASFIYGFGDFYGTNTSISYAIDSALSRFGEDVKNPKSEVEGKLIAYLMEYKVCSSFEDDLFFKGIQDLKVFLRLADTYFSKSDLDVLPYISLNINSYINEPIFMECFVPEVKVINSNFSIRYNLPYSIQNMLIKGNYGEFKSENPAFQISFEKLPPYNLVVDIDFSSVKNKDELIMRKNNLISFVHFMIPTDIYDLDTYSSQFKFINIYLEDILNNITIDDKGKISYEKHSIDCAPKIEEALSSLNGEIEMLMNYRNKFGDTVVERIFVEPTLGYLSNSKELLLYAKNNSLIKFKVEGPQSNIAISQGNLVILLLITLFVFFVVLIVLLIKMKEVKKPL